MFVVGRPGLAHELEVEFGDRRFIDEQQRHLDALVAAVDTLSGENLHGKPQPTIRVDRVVDLFVGDKHFDVHCCLSGMRKQRRSLR